MKQSHHAQPHRIARFDAKVRVKWRPRGHCNPSGPIALDRAGLMLGAGATPWHHHMLRDASAVVQRVRSAPVSAPTKQRAEALAQRIERQLRPGPLEWVPGR